MANSIGKLERAPVIFVIGQVQHNAVLQLDTYLPAIQDRFRKAGFPDYGEQKQIQLKLMVLQADANAPSQQFVTTRHQFLDATGTSGYVLANNSVSFETTAYDRWSDGFAGKLRSGLEIVHEAVGGLDYVDRIGLRFVDLVLPHAGRTQDYLHPEVRGLRAPLEEHIPDAVFQYSFSEMSFTVANGCAATARSIVQAGQLAFPADLQPLRLKLPARAADVTKEHAVLDSDAYFAARIPFDLDDIDAKFTRLHDLAESAFKAAVTKEAIAEWRRKE